MRRHQPSTLPLIFGERMEQVIVFAFSMIVLVIALSFPSSQNNENTKPMKSLSLWISILSSLLLLTASSNSNTSSAYVPKPDKKIMKAWRCHGRTQRDLVQHLKEARIIHSPKVQEVMNLVDRGNYVDQSPYMDTPQPIGSGQTISAPHMHAHALEEMLPYLINKQDLKILDVGCGSGYLTACLGRWVHAKEDGAEPILSDGKVYGIDIYPELVEMTQENLEKHDKDLLDSGTVTLATANGWEGLPEAAPFDSIHVGAAAAHFPKKLAQQLKVGGVMVIPIGDWIQNLYKIERVRESEPGKFVQNDYHMTELLGVRYVPLVNPK